MLGRAGTSFQRGFRISQQLWMTTRLISKMILSAQITDLKYRVSGIHCIEMCPLALFVRSRGPGSRSERGLGCWGVAAEGRES